MTRINNVTRRNQGDRGHIKSRACLAATGATIVRVTHGIATHIPQAAKDGFEAGRKDGQDLVTGLPYAAGATVGFAYGTSQAIVGVLATPINSLVGWAASAIGCGNRVTPETNVETGMA
jgi:hypothetical protein